MSLSATKAEGHPALEVADLDFSYSGRPILRQVGFSVAPGAFTVLLGPNGAGKTTLFSLITRLYDRRVGTIRVGGCDVRDLSTAALGQMGVVFQQPTLDLDLTVRQNLAYHAALHGMSPRTARQHAEEQVARLGLQEHLRRRVRELSGGQRRRVEIARGLLHQPRLLLLDEPTVGLDVASRRGIVEHVHRLSAEDGVAVLWATHLIDEVHATDQVVILDQGCVRADGSVPTIQAETGTATIADAFDVLTEAERV